MTGALQGQEENPFIALVPNQHYISIPRLELECGEQLFNAPIAYTTKGTLSKARDNVIVVCHALSGNAYVSPSLLLRSLLFSPKSQTAFVAYWLKRLVLLLIAQCLSETGNPDSAFINSNAAEWWGPLFGGPGHAFDVTKFFIICLNSLGSPYGSASPLTYKHGGKENGRYGPEFPLTTVRDDVRYVTGHVTVSSF